VHSDHLAGLESLRAPFVYCSAATREILLRLEKYYYRINFARGNLEGRRVTYERSVKRLIKPLPLETPTIIELSPGKQIRVTLFDANHCVGAVMFLIEGDNKAVLYTGDIRAETWWVNSLVQNPILLPYAHGIRKMDCMYLDTTFATKSESYGEFASKAQGIRELLAQVNKFPKDTIFYFHSWTFGYENVWIALSSFLNSEIHLDPYRLRLYDSLSPEKNPNMKLGDVREAAPLCGFRNGNHIQSGCLTPEENVRLHSCERGMGCSAVDNDVDAKVVHIIPIVTRSKGTEIAELGAGGGKGDMDQKEELDTADVDSVSKLMDLCASKIQDPELLSKVLVLLQQTLDAGDNKIDLGAAMTRQAEDSQDELSLQTLVSVLQTHITDAEAQKPPQNQTIRFPYSRHSSYSELCGLVDAFNPRDVYPCTVDDDSWTPALGMRSLFGQYCSSDVFRHDAEMMDAYELRMQSEQGGKRGREDDGMETQRTEESYSTAYSPVKSKRARPNTPTVIVIDDDSDLLDKAAEPRSEASAAVNSQTRNKVPDVEVPATSPPVYSPHTEHQPSPSLSNAAVPTPVPLPTPTSTSIPALAPMSNPQAPLPSTSHSTSKPPGSSKHHRRLKMTNARIAYNAASGFGLTWADYGGLVSTRRKEDREEVEL
jgi:hypothetical protein